MGYYNYNKVIASMVLSVLMVQVLLVSGNKEILVTMWNNAKEVQDMGVHCTESSSGSDYGVQPLPYHQRYEFRFKDMGEDDEAFCVFKFDGVIHAFSMYLGKRDRQVCGVNKQLCSWVIQLNGPCSTDTDTCYHWLNE